MPQPCRDRVSRTSRTSLSAYTVSPPKSGFGSVTSETPSAKPFWLVSGTMSPATTAIVRKLFTSGFPNSVFAA